MSKTLLTATLAAVLSAGLAAQDQTQPRQPQTPPGGAAAPATPGTQAPATPTTPRPTQSAAASNTITIEGCIQKGAGSSATPGATGTAGTAGDAFVLNNAMRPAGASGSGTIASSYRLDAEASKLTPHVGHKVEITGTVESASSSSGASTPSGAGAAGGAAPAGGGAAAGGAAAGGAASASGSSAANAPRLKVSEVKMLAATCTP